MAVKSGGAIPASGETLVALALLLRCRSMRWHPLAIGHRQGSGDAAGWRRPWPAGGYCARRGAADPLQNWCGRASPVRFAAMPSFRMAAGRQCQFEKRQFEKRQFETACQMGTKMVLSPVDRRLRDATG